MNKGEAIELLKKGKKTLLSIPEELMNDKDIIRAAISCKCNGLDWDYALEKISIKLKNDGEFVS